MSGRWRRSSPSRLPGSSSSGPARGGSHEGEFARARDARHRSSADRRPAMNPGSKGSTASTSSNSGRQDARRARASRPRPPAPHRAGPGSRRRRLHLPGNEPRELLRVDQHNNVGLASGRWLRATCRARHSSLGRRGKTSAQPMTESSFMGNTSAGRGVELSPPTPEVHFTTRAEPLDEVGRDPVSRWLASKNEEFQWLSHWRCQEH
jgi:hypothetical protein